MGLFNTLLKVAPVVIEVIGDIMDDGKKNNSNRNCRNNYNDYEDYDNCVLPCTRTNIK